MIKKLVWLTAALILAALTTNLTGCSTDNPSAVPSPSLEVTSPTLLYFYTDN